MSCVQLLELCIPEQEAPVIDARTAARLALAKAHRNMLLNAASAQRLSGDELSGEDTQAATDADELEARFVTGSGEVKACTTPIPRERSLSPDDSVQHSCTSMSTSRARQLCDKEVQVLLSYNDKDLKDDGGTQRGVSEEAEVLQHERMLFEKERQRWLDERSEWEREMVDRDRREMTLDMALEAEAQMRENDQKSKRAFSSIFEVDQEKIEFARQRQAWEQEKSDWEDRKAQWIQMAVAEEEKRQEEEKRREQEIVEWRIAAEREVERRVLEQTMSIEEASRIATVKVIEEYEERSRLLEAAMHERIRLLEEQNNIARAKMEEEINDLHDMAGFLVRERLRTLVVEHDKALEEEVKIEAEIELWAPERAALLSLPHVAQEGDMGKLCEDGNEKGRKEEAVAGSLSLSRSLSLSHWCAHSSSRLHQPSNATLVHDSQTLSGALMRPPRPMHELLESDDDEPEEGLPSSGSLSHSSSSLSARGDYWEHKMLEAIDGFRDPDQVVEGKTYPLSPLEGKFLSPERKSHHQGVGEEASNKLVAVLAERRTSKLIA